MNTEFKEQLKDIGLRAFKTFWQAALASAIINAETLFLGVTELDGEKLKAIGISVGLGALAAGLSAVYNGILKPLVGKLQTTKEQ